MSISALTTETDKLTRDFKKLNWFFKLFFPGSLKKVLNKGDASDIDIIHAAFNSTWFFHRWFFSNILGGFFKSDAVHSALWLVDPNVLPGGKKRILDNLKTLNQCTQPNMTTAVLCLLNPHGLYNEKAQRNLDAVRKHRTPDGVIVALDHLNQHDVFNTKEAQPSFNKVIDGLRSASADHIIQRLQRTGLLSNEHAHANLLALFSHHKSRKLGWTESTLALLDGISLLTQANYDAVIHHHKPYDLYDALNRLQKSELLSADVAQQHFDDLIKHHNPVSHANLLIKHHLDVTRPIVLQEMPVITANPIPLSPNVSLANSIYHATASNMTTLTSIPQQLYAQTSQWLFNVAQPLSQYIPAMPNLLRSAPPVEPIAPEPLPVMIQEVAQEAIPEHASHEEAENNQDFFIEDEDYEALISLFTVPQPVSNAIAHMKDYSWNTAFTLYSYLPWTKSTQEAPPATISVAAQRDTLFHTASSRASSSNPEASSPPSPNDLSS